MALLGTWDNQAQVAAADPALLRPPAAGTPYPWLDRQVAQFRSVEAPALAGPGSTVIHLVWRAGAPDGPVSRQRLWVFAPAPGGGWVMRFHAFRADPPPDAPPDGPAFRTLTAADVTSYPESCTLPVRPEPGGFAARIPEDCLVTARSGRRMTLSASIRLSGDELLYEEAGVLADGSFAFRVPNPGPYRFLRQQRGPARPAP